MKSSKSIIFLYVAWLSFIFGLQQIYAEDTNLTLTHVPTSSTDSGQDLSAPATYGYSGVIDANTNIEVNYTLPFSGMTLTNALSSFTAKNLNFNLTINNDIWSDNFFSVAKNQTINLSNLNLKIVESIVSHCANNLKVDSGSTLNIANDFTLNDVREHQNWFQSRLSFEGSGSVEIAGNLTITSQPKAYSDHSYNAAKLGVSGLKSFKVGGVVTISSTPPNTKNIFTLDPDWGATGTIYSRTIGGLDVEKNGYLELNGRTSSIHTVELNFTNSTKSEFIGSLATRINCVRDSKDANKILSYGDLVDNKLNIV